MIILLLACYFDLQIINKQNLHINCCSQVRNGITSIVIAVICQAYIKIGSQIYYHFFPDVLDIVAYCGRTVEYVG